MNQRLVMCPYCFESFPAEDLKFRGFSAEEIGPSSNSEDWVGSEVLPAESEVASTPGDLATQPDRDAETPKPSGDWLRRGLRGFLGETAAHQASSGSGHTTGRDNLIDGVKPWCPKCQLALPPNIEWARPVRIAVIGQVGSAKSSTIYSLVEMLRGGSIPYDLGWTSFGFATEADRHRYEEAYSSFVDSHKVIPTTVAGRDPASMTITCEAHLGGSDDEGYRTWNITFFDVAGETLRVERDWARNAQHMFVADAYVFTISCEALLVMAGHTGPDSKTDELPVGLSAVGDLLQQNIQGIRRYQELPDAASISAPAAFLITKTDLLASSPDDGYGEFERLASLAARAPTLAEGGDVDAYSDEVIVALEEVDGYPVLIPSRGFETARYFLVSPWGSQPVDGNVMAPKPVGVDSCVLWLIAQLGAESVHQGG